MATLGGVSNTLLSHQSKNKNQGAKINNQMIGSNPDIVSVFSFYSNKVITTGEGGVITTSNRKIAEKLKVFFKRKN